MDTWIYGKAFMGSWVIDPYSEPAYKFTRVLNILSEIRDLYIWISHEHSDHFDKWFIRRLIGQCIHKNITFLVPGFPGDSLKKSLTDLGASNIVSLSDQEQKTIVD